MAKKEKWREQIDRIRRYSERLRGLCEGVTFCHPAECYLDDVYAFFVTAHSTKEWVKNDPSLSISSKIIEDFVTANTKLAICADVANARKHLVCDPRRTGSEDYRSGAEPALRCHIQVIAVGGNTEVVNMTRTTSEPNFDPRRADEIRDKWIALGIEPENIELRLLIDIEHDNTTVDLDYGVADLAWDIADMWEKFVADN